MNTSSIYLPPPDPDWEPYKIFPEEGYDPDEYGPYDIEEEEDPIALQGL